MITRIVSFWGEGQGKSEEKENQLKVLIKMT